MRRFEGKTIMVTGGTSGMGRATAVLLAEEGAKVIIVGRNEVRGKEVVADITSKGNVAEFIQCDLGMEKNIECLKKYVEEKYESLDGLFNNAGIWVTRALDEIDEETVEKVFRTNFNSALFMIQQFSAMLKKSHGAIVNNASMGGLEGYTNGSKQYLYHTSKAALIKFSKLSAKNLAPDIRVNCICPGLIDTEIFENRDFSRFDGQIPIGRLGESSEVANVVAFLLSQEASYVTGAVITVDGGAALI